MFFKIATTGNTISVNTINLHEFLEMKFLLGVYTGDIKVIGDLVIGEHKGSKAMRFAQIEAYESYIKTIDLDYDADDSVLCGYIYYLNTQLHLN